MRAAMSGGFRWLLAAMTFSVSATVGAAPPEKDRSRVSLPWMEGRSIAEWQREAREMRGRTPVGPRSQPGAGVHRGGHAKGERDGKGFEWTVVEPSPDTRLVFVSASAGDDENSGLYANLPVRTIEKGKSLLRDGYPDHLLLKRGDVWEDESFGRWKLSGRSSEEPMVVGAYGEGARPLVRTGTANRGFWLDGGQVVEHVTIMGIELHAHTYVGEGGAEAGILFLGGGVGVVIEDCLIRGYKDNVVLNGFGGELKDVTVRGCVIVDAFSTIAHAQGFYASDAHGILVEGCVFDHNGWSEEVAGADPTVFNHNVYIQMSCSDVIVRNNVIMNGASHGVQLRPGGVCEDNLILYNAIGVLAGNAGDAPPVEVAIRGNVIMFADDIAPDKPRGMGIDLQHVKRGTVTGNVLAHNESAKPYGHAVMLHCGKSSPVTDLRISGNTIYDWQGGLKIKKEGFERVHVVGNVVQAEDGGSPIVKHEAPFEKGLVRYEGNVYHSESVPVAWFQVGADTYNFGAWKDLAGDEGSAPKELSFEDAARTPATYQAHVGGASGLEGFVAALRSQSRDAWNDDYSVPALLDYFRAGFGIDAQLGQAAGLVGQ